MSWLNPILLNRQNDHVDHVVGSVTIAYPAPLTVKVTHYASSRDNSTGWRGIAGAVDFVGVCVVRHPRDDVRHQLFVAFKGLLQGYR